MQRIRSQLVSIPQQPTLINQSRPNSKKAIKAQTLDTSYHCINKPLNNNNQIISQYPIQSLKNANVQSTGSMKNLKNCSYQCKNHMQTTTRQGNSHSAISARILKQIIGYSNRGNKNKQINKDFNDAIHLQIDLDQQIQYIYQKYDKQNKNCNQYVKSHQTQTKNSSNGKSQGNNKKQEKRQHKIIQEFSPTPQQPDKSRKSINLCEDKPKTKEHCYFMENQQKKKKCANQLQIKNKVQLYKASQNSKQLSPTKQDIHSSQTSQHQQQQQKDGEQQNNQFINIISHESKLLKKQKYHNQNFQQQAQIKQEKPKQLKKDKTNKINKQEAKKIDQFYQSIKHKSLDVLLQDKQNFTILLQQCSVFIQQHFQLSYKQLIPLWKGLIQSQQKKVQIKQQIQKLQGNIKILLNESSIKKTTLFQLNRDQITRKKQKQLLSKATKQKCIQQAKTLQQQLYLKLSSKVDYEHIILFNQKIMMPAQISTQQPQKIYRQLFEKKQSKKQLNNLNLYDTRLIQQYLKKIQQYQYLYHQKIDQNILFQKNFIIGQYTNHCHQQYKIQKLVEQIQSINFKISSIQIQKQLSIKKIQDIYVLVNQYHHQIRQHLIKTNKKISGEYKITEGCSFDFKIMLEDKFSQQFLAYQKEINYRNTLIHKLQKIQKLIITKQKSTVEGNYDSLSSRPNSQKDTSNRNGNKNKGKLSKRSCSLISTPSNKQSIMIQQDIQNNIQNNIQEAKSNIDQNINLKKYHIV